MKCQYILIFIVVLIITLLTIFIINFYNGYRSTTYAMVNDIFCSQNEDKCNIQIQKLSFPTSIVTDYNFDLAKFNSNLLLKLKKDIIDEPAPIYKIIRDGIIYSVIYKDNTNIYINFRGTTTFQDETTDYNIQEIIRPETSKIKSFLQQEIIFNKGQLQAINLNSDSSRKNPKIHRGFFDMYQSVHEEILQYIDSSITNVIISGHSLGGAISILCGVDIAIKWPDINIIVYTFASPKVGDENFRDLVISQNNLFIYRVVNTNDIIPTTPPAVVPNLSNYKDPYFYSHVGNPIFFEDQRYSNGENHALTTYISNLKSDLIPCKLNLN